MLHLDIPFGSCRISPPPSRQHWGVLRWPPKPKTPLFRSPTFPPLHTKRPEETRPTHGTEYGVVLTPKRAFCSCKDSLVRHTICKHAVILALHVIRTPQTEAEMAVTRPVNLSLGKIRKGFVFPA
jgi:hypothetical protein